MDPAIAHAMSREKLSGGDADTARERAYSPERNVRADQPPLWLLHAEDDDVVKVENSVRLREATRGIGAPVEAHFFERGGHGFGLMKSAGLPVAIWPRSEEHTSELQSLMRISYAVFCLKKKKTDTQTLRRKTCTRKNT